MTLFHHAFCDSLRYEYLGTLPHGIWLHAVDLIYADIRRIIRIILLLRAPIIIAITTACRFNEPAMGLQRLLLLPPACDI